MTTREDYEHAALAAGMAIYINKNGKAYLGTEDDCKWTEWRPIEDDGDSRRLEVACRMKVKVGQNYSSATTSSQISGYCKHDTDPCAATRKAVFRCAV